MTLRLPSVPGKGTLAFRVPWSFFCAGDVQGLAGRGLNDLTQYQTSSTVVYVMCVYHSRNVEGVAVDKLAWSLDDGKQCFPMSTYFLAQRYSGASAALLDLAFWFGSGIQSSVPGSMPLYATACSST